jgi:hypothetical protein
MEIFPTQSGIGPHTPVPYPKKSRFLGKIFNFSRNKWEFF